MSQPLSAVIDYLSTSANLASLASWTSQKVQTLEYSSLSISFNSDVNHSIYFLFSDDGINFDVSSPFTFTPLQSYTGGENYVSPCLAQWVKIQLVNTSASSSTYTRLYTYGSINNLAAKAIIQGSVNVNGANLSITSPTTPLGFLATENYNVVSGSAINCSTMPNGGITSFDFLPPNPLLGDQLIAQATLDSTARYGINNGLLSLYNLAGASLGSIARFYNRNFAPYVNGRNYIIQFTSLFRYPYTDGSHPCNTQAGFGICDKITPTAGWLSGFAIGTYIPVLFSGVYIPYCIKIYGSLSETFIYQPNFNMDTLDGSRSTQNPSGMNLQWNYLNTFRIILNCSCVDNVLFQVLDQRYGTFITFHRLTYNPTAIAQQLSYGGSFIMDVEWIADIISYPINGLAITNSVIFSSDESPSAELGLLMPLTVSNISSVTTSVSAEISLYNNFSFSSKQNPSVIKITELIFVNNAGSGYFLSVVVYKNNTYSSPLTYTDVDAVRSGIQYNLSGTIPSAYGYKLKTYMVSNYSTLSIHPDDLFISPNEELLLVWNLSSGASATNCGMVVNMIQI